MSQRAWKARLEKACSGFCFWKMVVCGAVLLCLSGCGEGSSAVDSGQKDEVAKLRQDVSRLKEDVARLKDAVLDMRRRADMQERYREKFRPPAGTNGLARAMGRKGLLTREEMEARKKEMEARRKMMQDPEMRKKLEAEHKARMEERRRQHEERRREMEERRRARPAPDAAAAPAK